MRSRISIAIVGALATISSPGSASAQGLDVPVKVEITTADRWMRWGRAEALRLHNEAVDRIGAGRQARAGRPRSGAYERMLRSKGVPPPGAEDWKKALELLGQALEKDSTIAEVHYALGYCRVVMGHLDTARDHFQQALKLRPSYTEASRALTLTNTALEWRASRGRDQ